jgi:hypothetical protein
MGAFQAEVLKQPRGLLRCFQWFFAMLGTGETVYSFAHPDPGSGAFFGIWIRIRDKFFPDHGSRIPDQTHIF